MQFTEHNALVPLESLSFQVVEEFTVVWDIQNAGSGYDAKAETKYKKGESLPQFETVNGQVLTVGRGLVTRVKAESTAEAIEVARNVYGPGNHSGVSMVGKTTNVETKAT